MKEMERRGSVHSSISPHSSYDSHSLPSVEAGTKVKFFKKLFKDTDSEADHSSKTAVSFAGTDMSSHESSEDIAQEDKKTSKSNYSANMEPLRFTMTVDNPDHTIDAANPNPSFINKEEYENYLQEPRYIKVYNRSRYHRVFRCLFLAQEIQSGGGPIWSTVFSKDGRFMATAGKCNMAKIWKVVSSPMERTELDSPGLYGPVFLPKPYKVLEGHSQEILEVTWSKNNFILTASMDKTCKLWHIDKPFALKSFVHTDFVTSVRFHPTDDRFFVSGCLDHQVRLWSILDGQEAYNFNVDDLVTCLDFTVDGQHVVVGTFNGHVYVLETRGLELVYKFHVLDGQSKSGDLKPTTKDKLGPKVTGIECFGPAKARKICVTSADSRVRVFSISERRLLETLRGCKEIAQMKASVKTGVDGSEHVLVGSQDHWIYCWKVGEATEKNSPVKKGVFKKLLTHNAPPKAPKHTVIKNNDYVAFHAHHSTVTTSIFAPSATSKVLSLSNDTICELTNHFYTSQQDTDVVKWSKEPKFKMPSRSSSQMSHNSHQLQPTTSIAPTAQQVVGIILVSTDENGTIRVFRSDISPTIRKKVLHEFQLEHELQKKEAKCDYSQLKAALPSAITVISPTLGLIAAASSRLESCSSSPYTHTNGSMQSLLGTRARTRSNTVNSHHSVDRLTVCDVCGGSNFTKKTGSLGRVAKVCDDCGNEITGFR